MKAAVARRACEIGDQAGIAAKGNARAIDRRLRVGAADHRIDLARQRQLHCRGGIAHGRLAGARIERARRVARLVEIAVSMKVGASMPRRRAVSSTIWPSPTSTVSILLPPAKCRAALIAISGPMPLGSPRVMAIFHAHRTTGLQARLMIMSGPGGPRSGMSMIIRTGSRPACRSGRRRRLRGVRRSAMCRRRRSPPCRDSSRWRRPPSCRRA